MQRQRHQPSKDGYSSAPFPVARPNVLVAQSTPENRMRFVAMLKRAFPQGSVIVSDGVQQSLQILDRHSLDIAVIDNRLPDGSGLHLVQRCVRSNQLTRSVITLPHDDEVYLMEALAAGASGYLLGSQPDAVLIRQLQLLAEGIPPLAAPVAARLFHYFTAQSKQHVRRIDVNHRGDNVQLSKAEEQVLSSIAASSTISEVARALDISTDDVCGYVKRIYVKRHRALRAEADIEFRYARLA